MCGRVSTRHCRIRGTRGRHRSASPYLQQRHANASGVFGCGSFPPDVLLVDEVLAVGDLAFQQKCLDRIRELRSGGCSIVLVSHDPVLVENMCDSALWLSKGEIVEAGPAPNIIHKYAAAVGATPAPESVEIVSMTTQGVVLHPARTASAGWMSRSRTSGLHDFGYIGT